MQNVINLLDDLGSSFHICQVLSVMPGVILWLVYRSVDQTPLHFDVI